VSDKRKNILFVWLDGLRADRLGCYGYKKETTPALDRLAASGAVFLNNYSVSNSTIPAYYSINTGLYPCVHKAASTSGFYDGAYPFLTDLLREVGYRTFGIGNNVAAFSPEWGFIRGYDQYYAIGKIRNWFKESKEAQRGFNKWAIRKSLADLLTKTSPHLSDWLRTKYADNYYRYHDMGGAKAVEVFENVIADIARDRNKPFMGYVNIPEAHSPYMPPQFCRNNFGVPTLTTSLVLLNMFPSEFQKRGLNLIEGEIHDLSLLYDSSVNYVDMLLQKIVDALKKHDLFEDTVLFLFGDHGGNLYEKRDYIGAASYTYQAEIKVPLVLVNADGLVGQFPRLTSLTDIFPTALDIAGVEIPSGKPYRCLSLLEQNDGHDAILVDYPNMPSWLLKHNPDIPAKAFLKYNITNRTLIRKEGWKLIWRNDGAHELYDLARDPSEDNNLYLPERVKAFELIEQMKKIYCELLGEQGRHPEIYEYHSVGPGMEWLPPIQSLNPSFDPKSFINVDNPGANSVLKIFSNEH
jgi:arylsulfatase A-like enzyme